MPRSKILLVLLLGVVPVHSSLQASEDSPRIVGDPVLGKAALAAVEAYHQLDVEYLEPRLSDGFRFVERNQDQDLDGAGFLAMVPTQETEFKDRQVEIAWVGAIPSGEGKASAEVRGRWRGIAVKSNRDLDLRFSSRLDLKTSPEGVQIESWTDVYSRGRLWRPILGDGQYLSDHFDIRFLSAEFDNQGAARLSALAETWYERTSEYLGRHLESGRRVLIDVASCHEVPYASAPGPEAFFLIGVKHAQRDYGFSLVHELTHNLMDRSHLSMSSRDKFPRGGNRLLDEGFGVYVEERLVDHGRVFPNFGEEIHGAYLELHGQMAIPRPPLLEAEELRTAGGDKTRLGYLQQASFVKWLVEVAPGQEATDGLRRFKELFERDLDALSELYGRGLPELEEEWLAYLESLPDRP